jgi:competence transcription factor ComK
MMYTRRLTIMEDASLKNQLINSILQKQQFQQHQQQKSAAPTQGQSRANAVKTVELPDQAVLDEFKNQVKMWVEIDNNIRKLKQAARERNVVKKQLTEKILMFMAKYNIEDLNTRDGSRLRYKVSSVKEPLTANKIKERLEKNIGNINSLDDLNEKVFTAKKVERVSLRRLKRQTLDV